MTTLERNLLKVIRKSLLEATETNWNCGDHEQWLNYAKKMRITIDTQMVILETLISEETNPIKKEEPVMDDSETADDNKQNKLTKIIKP